MIRQFDNAVTSYSPSSIIELFTAPLRYKKEVLHKCGIARARRTAMDATCKQEQNLDFDFRDNMDCLANCKPLTVVLFINC